MTLGGLLFVSVGITLLWLCTYYLREARKCRQAHAVLLEKIRKAEEDKAAAHQDRLAAKQLFQQANEIRDARLEERVRDRCSACAARERRKSAS